MSYEKLPTGGLTVVAASGAAETLDLAGSAEHTFDVTMDQNCTFTLAGARAGKACTISLYLRQGAGGSKVPTFPGSVTWASGSTPTWQTVAGNYDVITLQTLDGGTSWLGFDITPDTSAGVGQGAMLKRLATVSILNNTTTTVTFDTEVYDDLAMVNIGAQPTRLTIATTGRYFIGFGAQWANNSTSGRLVVVYRGSAADYPLFADRRAAFEFTDQTGGQPLQCASGDWFQLQVHQTSGGALDLTGAVLFAHLLKVGA